MSGSPTVADYVVKAAGACPGLSRGLLRVLSPALPNRWIFNRIIQRCGGTFVTRARLGNGMHVRVLLGDMVGCHIWASGFYEPHLVRLVQSYLTPDTVFFDVGAHVGQYTLLSAPLVAEVHSFEPTPTTFKLLKANVESNRLGNVQANQCAVSDYDGTAELYLADAGNVGKNSLLGFPDSMNRCTVPCVSLDHYLLSRNIDIAGRPVLVKIDVEGAELRVLRGASDLLATRPVVLFEVLPTANEADQIFDLFTNHGFQLFAATGDRILPLHQTIRADYSNVLAVPL